jgi:hypothetical protein
MLGRVVFNCGLAIGFLVPASAATARVVETEVFVAEFPEGWRVERETYGFDAMPTVETQGRSLSITFCKRSDQGCSMPCDAESIRPNFFYFFRGEGQIPKYSDNAFASGVKEFRGIGRYGSAWIASSVLCGARAVVQLGATSSQSEGDAVSQLDALLKSFRWR